MTYLLGHSVPDEAIEQALKRQLDDVAGRIAGNTLDAYLAIVLLNVKPERRAAFRDWIFNGNATEQWPPDITFAYRREPIRLPCIAIRLLGDDSPQAWVGESAGYRTLDDGRKEEIHADSWNVAVEVAVESDNADICRYLYALLKFWLGQERINLSRREFGGFVTFKMKGREVQPYQKPDASGTGRFIFRREVVAFGEVHQTDSFDERSTVTGVDVSPTEVASAINSTFVPPV